MVVRVAGRRSARMCAREGTRVSGSCHHRSSTTDTSEEATGGGPPTVLIVDDDASILRLIAVTLEDAGMAVIREADGISALKRLEECTPDVLVLDLQLPGITGRDLFQQARERGWDVPTVIVSAYGARRAQREIGADAALEKPFDPEVLLDKVRGLVRAPRR